MAKALIVGLTIAVVFVVAEIKVQRGEPSEEARAIGALRAVATAQRAYAAANGGYATSLNTLAAPCSGQRYGFIAPNLSSDPTALGRYEIRIHADTHTRSGRADCHGNSTARAYYATAVVLEPGGAAMRAFAVDQNDVIWYDAAGGAAPTPPFSESATVKRLP